MQACHAAVGTAGAAEDEFKDDFKELDVSPAATPMGDAPGPPDPEELARRLQGCAARMSDAENAILAARWREVRYGLRVLRIGEASNQGPSMDGAVTAIDNDSLFANAVGEGAPASAAHVAAARRTSALHAAGRMRLGPFSPSRAASEMARAGVGAPEAETPLAAPASLREGRAARPRVRHKTVAPLRRIMPPMKQWVATAMMWALATTMGPMGRRGESVHRCWRSACGG